MRIHDNIEATFEATQKKAEYIETGRTVEYMKEKSNTHLKQHKRILCQNVVRLMIRVCVFGS